MFTGYRLLWCQELLWLPQLWSPCRAHRVLTQPFRLMQSCGLYQTQHESRWALIWNFYCLAMLYRLPIQVRTGHASMSIFQHASFIVQSTAGSLQLCCRIWFTVRAGLKFALISHMFMSWASLHHMAFVLCTGAWSFRDAAAASPESSSQAATWAAEGHHRQAAG